MGSLEAKVTRLKREIEQEKANIMQRASMNATQMESLRRTVIVKLAVPPRPQDDSRTGMESTAEIQKKSQRGRTHLEKTPSKAEAAEIVRLMLSDELGPWSIVSEVRPPSWGELIVSLPLQAFHGSTRIEFHRLTDMEAALAQAKSGSVVLTSTGQKVKLRTIPLRPVAVEEAEAAQRGEMRPSGRLHDAEHALDTTIERLKAAALEMAELDQEEAAMVRTLVAAFSPSI